MIDFLLKFECSAGREEKLRLKLIDSCIGEPEIFLSYAIKLIAHMISNSRSVFAADQADAAGFNTVQHLKYLLVKIRNLQADGRDVIVQLSKAEVYACLADLGRLHYKAVFNAELSISLLAIEVFEQLRSRTKEIEQLKPVRDDELCLLLMQALNKFRDIIETHQESDPKIGTEKALLVGLVVKLMNQELASMLQSA